MKKHIFLLLCFAFLLLMPVFSQEVSEKGDIVKMSTEMRSISFFMTFHEDAEVTIHWGDGISEEYQFKKDTWTQVSHFYPSGDNHKITVYGDNKLLKGINLHGTYIDHLDVAESIGLYYLRISHTYIPFLDLGKNYELRHLYAGDSLVEKIEIWNNPYLNLIVIYNTPLESNSVELIELVKSLSVPKDSAGTIHLYNNESISWIEDISKGKSWLISKEYYR